jgi:hypothetical protein
MGETLTMLVVFGLGRGVLVLSWVTMAGIDTLLGPEGTRVGVLS